MLQGKGGLVLIGLKLMGHSVLGNTFDVSILMLRALGPLIRSIVASREP